MKENHKGFLSGLIGSLISSVCCITPLLLLLLGIGNLSLAVWMGVYRIYFIFAGLLFVILALANHIRMKARRCACSNIQMMKQESKLIFTTLASFFIIFSVINFLILPYATTTISAKSDVVSAKPDSLKQLRLKIDGMTCEGCAVAIGSTLKNVRGVIDAKVSYDNGTAIIIYNPSVINPQQIVDSVPKPYLAKIVSNEDVEE